MRSNGTAKSKKLSLNKETLRALADHELAQVGGGISFPGSICNFSQAPRGCVTIAFSNCQGCTTETSIFF